MVSELHSDLRGNVGQFAKISHRKDTASGHFRHLGKQRGPFQFFRRSGTYADRIEDADCVELAVGFFQIVLYVALIVPTMIIPSIRYDEQGPFAVVCTPHLAQPEVDGIQERGAPTRGGEHHAVLQFIHAAGEAAG